MDPNQVAGAGAVYLAIAIFIIVAIFKAVRIVPQSMKFVIERFGRLHSVLGPGINFTVPFLDRVAHKVSILERQLPTAHQDAITTDNVMTKVETSVFYRIISPEKTVYRIKDVDGAIATTVAGIVRSEIGKMELDQVQSNRNELTANIREHVRAMVDDWGIEVTRAEILDVSLDEATRHAMEAGIAAMVVHHHRQDVRGHLGEVDDLDARINTVLDVAGTEQLLRKIVQSFVGLIVRRRLVHECIPTVVHLRFQSNKEPR